MQFADHKDASRQRMSPSIYAALVDSLFENPIPMLAGSICAGAAATLTAIKTGNDWLWLCVVLIIGLGIQRSIQLHRYQMREHPLGAADAPKAERHYKIAGSAYAAALGLWCVIVLLGSDDAVAHMLATAVTVAYTAAGAGRTYGRPIVAQLQILLACGPMAAALIFHGDFYYVAFAILNVLFFIGLRRISLRLHEVYVDALVANEQVASIANQFDTALNNMPNGLCMFTPSGRLAVINNRFMEMMRIAGDQTSKRVEMSGLIEQCVAAGSVSAASAKSIVAGIERSEAREITTLDYAFDQERALNWIFQPMRDGGSVVLLEDITERRNSEARISHLARFDDLTGLPNRVSFRREIGKVLDEQEVSEVSALLFIDLDQFKQVNDTLGHPTGDKLLCMVAGRLREMLRLDDFVARFGGDEFVVFQRNIHSPNDAADLAARIVDGLSERYEVDYHQIEIGASIGIALHEPGLSVDALLKHADMALYRAKAAGRGTFCYFKEEMAQTVEARRLLELDLRNALANEEFEVFYQPLVNLKSGRVETCEALLRWNHPVRGMVPPTEIIPVAEEMGLILELGRWILRTACIECAKWPEAVSVAVNFSPLQFHQREVLKEVEFALGVSGLKPNRLEIEITESSLLKNTRWTRDALEQLHAAGVRISLDDFGTGYSSLSYLHSFPLQKVKIDRSFLEGIDTQRPLTLLRGVARLSADLGMSVVVEGVETDAQLALISQDGTVTEAQGYYFSRPVSAAQIMKLLRASHGDRHLKLVDKGTARTSA